MKLEQTFKVEEHHIAEAKRRIAALGRHDLNADLLAQALAEPAWQPPAGPDLIEARECAALAYEADCSFESARSCRAAKIDKSYAVQSALIAIKRSKSNG